MLSITSAQLDAWIGLLMYPLTRVLALVAVAPPFSNQGMPMLTRLAVGLAVTFALMPVLPAMPAVTPDSAAGLAILMEQVLIGLAMGFAMQLAFSAIEVAGELIGLEMGLSFAVFYDPQSSGQTAVVSELMTLLATLIFLSLNGHLMLLSLLAQSFTALPVGQVLAPLQLANLAGDAAMMFTIGLMLALPIVAALMMTTLALGVLQRAAPQLNLFAVGFPVTLMVGFAMLALAMPYFAPSFEHLFDQGFQAIQRLIEAPRQAH